MRSAARLQGVDKIGLLPREAAIGFSLAAEMATGCGARIDRLVEIEIVADAMRRQFLCAHQNVLELGWLDFACFVGPADQVGLFLARAAAITPT
jgi:hypothetical protein